YGSGRRKRPLHVEYVACGPDYNVGDREAFAGLHADRDVPLGGNDSDIHSTWNRFRAPTGGGIPIAAGASPGGGLRDGDVGAVDVVRRDLEIAGGEGSL